LAARDRADGTLGRATRPEDAAADALVIHTDALNAHDVIAEILAQAEWEG
jgi:cytidylate kinase